MKKLLLTLLCCPLLLAAADLPVHNWDFCNMKPLGKNKVIFSSGGAVRPSELYSVKAPGPQGLAVAPGVRPYRVLKEPLRFQDVTIEIDFTLTAPLKKQTALFTYAEHSWGQGLFGIYFTPKNQALIRFNLAKEKTPLKKHFGTPPMDLQLNRKHRLTVNISSGKCTQFYLDGKLVSERNNTPGLAAFTVPFAKYHPEVHFGCTNERNKPEQHLPGTLHRVAIYDRIQSPAKELSGAQLCFKKTASAPVIDGKISDEAWQKGEWSRKFMVLGQENSDINGLWEGADTRFHSVASTASVLYDDNNLYIAFRNPVPAGMKAGAGDGIELFLQPQAGGAFYQLLLDSGNKPAFIYYGTPDGSGVPWKAEGIKHAVSADEQGFTAELLIPLKALGIDKAPASGTMWRGNFCRTGKTCGGLSTWAPVGNNFCSPEGFGQLIFGKRSDYFKNVLQELTRKGMNDETLSKEIAEKGDDPAAWEELQRSIESGRKALIRQRNAGKTSLLWQTDKWRQFSPDTAVPLDVKPLESMELLTMGKARAIGSFMVSNLSNRTGMFSLNVTWSSNRDFTGAIRFRNLDFVELQGKRIVPDPVFDLPQGNVLKVGAGKTAAVWLDVDTKKLKPGKYTARIELSPAYSGFAKENFILHVRVGHVDALAVDTLMWTYPLRYAKDIRDLTDYPFNTSCLLPRHFLPVPDKNGKADYSEVDRIYQAFVENGIPPESIRFILYGEFPKPDWVNLKTADGKVLKYRTPEWRAEYIRRLRNFRDYIKSKYNMSYDRFIFSVIDEPSGDPANPKSKAYAAVYGAELVKEADPEIRRFCNPYRDGHEVYFKNFEILEPYMNLFLTKPEMIKKFKESKRELWTYRILEKYHSPVMYRRMSWFNLHHGFDGPATVYDLYHMSGDGFLSGDSAKNSKVTADYGTIYRNLRTGAFSVSRRMEAWYLGQMDARLAKYCRAKLKEKGQSTAELDRIIARGAAPDGNLEAAAGDLFWLGEKLSRQ